MQGEWEYHTIESTAPKVQYFDVVVGADTTSEASARLTFWYKRQAEIMQTFQPWLDNGWEPVGEIGPGVLILTTSAEHSKGFFGDAVWYVCIRLQLVADWRTYSFASSQAIVNNPFRQR